MVFLKFDFQTIVRESHWSRVDTRVASSVFKSPIKGRVQLTGRVTRRTDFLARFAGLAFGR